MRTMLAISPSLFISPNGGSTLDVSSLALIGNASRQTLGAEGISIRGVFDEETRRKPLAFAADAVRYGI
jgi:hypothetical protein